MARFEYRHQDSAAAMAANWRRVLLVDGVVALVVIGLGILAVVKLNAIVGWIVVVLGAAYVLALVGRYRAWQAKRAREGLDG